MREGIRHVLKTDSFAPSSGGRRVKVYKNSRGRELLVRIIAKIHDTDLWIVRLFREIHHHRAPCPSTARRIGTVVGGPSSSFPIRDLSLVFVTGLSSLIIGLEVLRHHSAILGIILVSTRTLSSLFLGLGVLRLSSLSFGLDRLGLDHFEVYFDDLTNLPEKHGIPALNSLISLGSLALKSIGCFGDRLQRVFYLVRIHDIIHDFSLEGLSDTLKVSLEDLVQGFLLLRFLVVLSLSSISFPVSHVDALDPSQRQENVFKFSATFL